MIEKLGLRSGDRLTKMNGLELTSTEHILEAYARLRVATRMALEVVRGGTTLELDYEVR